MCGLQSAPTPAPTQAPTPAPTRAPTPAPTPLPPPHALSTQEKVLIAVTVIVVAIIMVVAIVVWLRKRKPFEYKTINNPGDSGNSNTKLSKLKGPLNTSNTNPRGSSGINTTLNNTM